jgi:hypothetical protein
MHQKQPRRRDKARARQKSEVITLRTYGWLATAQLPLEVDTSLDVTTWGVVDGASNLSSVVPKQDQQRP